MATPKDEQLAWLRAVMAYLGMSANALAVKAGISPSTIQRPLNDPQWDGTLSARTMSAVAAVAGVRVMEFPQRGTGRGGFGEAEAEPFRFDQDKNAIAANFDRAVRELTQGRPGRDAWIIRSHALELSGILPGDVAIVDLNVQPRPKDVVLAQIYHWATGGAESVFRVYEPPYLLTNSMREGLARPVLVDGENVVIKGVVDGVLRRRAN